MKLSQILAPLVFLGCSASTAAPAPGGATDGGVHNDAADAAVSNIEWVAEGGSNENVWRIAVNSAYVAWTAKEATTVSQPSAGAVHVWPKSGGAARTVWSGRGEVNALAVDDTDLYFQLQKNDTDLTGVVYRAKLAGGAPEVISNAAYGAGPLVIDATRVFFRSGSSRFSVIAKTGGAAPRDLGADLPLVLEPFDETVFMSSLDTLYRFDLASGASETIGTLDRSGGMVRLGDSICYLDLPSGGKPRVVSYVPATKKSSDVFTFDGLGEAIATDGRDLFVASTRTTNDGSVYRHRAGDASPTPIVSGVSSSALAVDDRHVYVGQGTKVGRVDKNL